MATLQNLNLHFENAETKLVIFFPKGYDFLSCRTAWCPHSHFLLHQTPGEAWSVSGSQRLIADLHGTDL